MSRKIAFVQAMGRLEWILCFLCGLLALHLVSRDLNVWANSVGIAAERRRLRRVSQLLQEIEETLCAGVLPTSEKWESVRQLPGLWGPLVFQSLSELRANGAALLPTLRRLRNLADEHQVSLMDAKAKASQSLSQALVCSLLVPIFGTVLYLLLPGVSDHPYQWTVACFAALLLASLGSAWLLHLSSNARWGGLDRDQRVWVLLSQCAGERFLALVRSGTPADLAWTQACELLIREAPEFAESWGSSVWGQSKVSSSAQGVSARVLIETGGALKRAVQLSLMEGRPCTERVENALLALRQELRAQVDRELSLLGTRALKPLFICVAPSVLMLMGVGVWMAWVQVSSGVEWTF